MITLDRVRNLFGWLVLAGLIGFIVFSLVWRMDGGRWERVDSPSMGTIAPVGSLLWVKPVDFDSLEPGDFITFHSPGNRTVTYSHLVDQVNPDRTVYTKGVIPQRDPWRIGPDDVVGEVQMNWWGVGWLVRAGPVLLASGGVLFVLRRIVRGRWRAPMTLLGAAIGVCVAIVLYRPLLNAEQLSTTPERTGGASATYVATGLLPVRISETSGAALELKSGEVGSVRVLESTTDGRYEVRLGPAIPWWWWAVLVGFCFVPALWSSIPRRRAGPRHAHA